MSALADYAKRISNELVLSDWALLRQNFFYIIISISLFVMWHLFLFLLMLFLIGINQTVIFF